MSESSSILEFYKRLGLVSGSGNPLPVHRACPSASICWKGYADRYPPDDPGRSAISSPYIGTRYAEVGLLVLGINQNDWGGLDALSQLVRDARREIREGAQRVFKNPSYVGSILWHRVGCFAAAFAEAAGVMPRVAGVGDLPSAREIDAAYEFMAFTNHVKCSPVGQRSAPADSMWTECGNTILREEVRLLRPRHVLVLGTTDNRLQLAAGSLRAEWEPSPRIGSVWRGKATVDDFDVSLYAMPHPSLGVGAGRARFAELREVLGTERS